jgi:hypothetical protein
MTSTLEQKIEALKEKYNNDLQADIDKLIKSEGANDARSALSKKLYDEYFAFNSKQAKEKKEFEANEAKQKADFEKEYGVPYETEKRLLRKKSTKPKLSIAEKAKIVFGLKTANGEPKYYIYVNNNMYKLFNEKNEEVTSSVVFKDKDGNKQTAIVGTLTSFIHSNSDYEKEYQANFIKNIPTK